MTEFEVDCVEGLASAEMGERRTATAATSTSTSSLSEEFENGCSSGNETGRSSSSVMLSGSEKQRSFDSGCEGAGRGREGALGLERFWRYWLGGEAAAEGGDEGCRVLREMVVGALREAVAGLGGEARLAPEGHGRSDKVSWLMDLQKIGLFSVF